MISIDTLLVVCLCILPFINLILYYKQHILHFDHTKHSIFMKYSRHMNKAHSNLVNNLDYLIFTVITNIAGILRCILPTALDIFWRYADIFGCRNSSLAAFKLLR